MQIINSTIQTIRNHLPENPLPVRDRVTEIALSALKIVVHYSTRTISLYGVLIATANLPSVLAIIILYLSTVFLGCLYIRPLTHDASAHLFNHKLIKDGCLPAWMLKLNVFLGMDPNAKSGRRTMLEHAVESGNVRIAQALIKSKKINPNLPNNLGNSLIHTAIELGNTEMTRLLVNSPSVDCNLPSSLGNRPLHCAVKKNNAEILNILLDCPRVKCNLTNLHGVSPLFYAISKNNAKLLKILVNCLRVNCDLTNEYRNLPLHAALKLNNTELLDILINCTRIDLNKPNSGGSTPLYLAISDLRDDPKFVCKLLESEKIKVDLAPNNRLGRPHLTPFQHYVFLINHYLKDIATGVPPDRAYGRKHFKHYEKITPLFITKRANYDFLNKEGYEQVKLLLMPLINEIRKKARIKQDSSVKPFVIKHVTTDVIAQIVLDYLPNPLDRD